MRRLRPWLLALVAMMVSAPALSQDVPPLRTGELDACYGASSYWQASLGDALADRAAFLCACRTSPGSARVTIALEVHAGAIASCEPSETVDTAHDEASCVAHRAHAVAHAWLASSVSHLGATQSTSEAHASYDYASIECPAPGGTDVQSGFSRAFVESHPHGLRRGVTLPSPVCRRPITGSFRLPFAW